MPTAVYRQILAAVKTIATGTGVGGGSVIERALPRTFEGVEGIPVCIVTPEASVGLKPFAFENIRQATYRVQVGVLASYGQDYVTPLGTTTLWHELLQDALLGDDGLLDNVPEVVQTRILDTPVVDQAAMTSSGYSWTGVMVEYEVIR